MFKSGNPYFTFRTFLVFSNFIYNFENPSHQLFSVFEGNKNYLKLTELDWR